MKKQMYDYPSGPKMRRLPLFAVAFLLITTMFSISKAEENTVIKESAIGVPLPQQQKMTIKGTVLDTYKEPVIGANVVEKGTTNGTVTNIDGEFSLNVSPGATLDVSFIGYVSQSVAVRGEVVNIILVEDTQTLDEVVVTGFGMAQKKATLTGAITAINSEDLSRSSSINASTALAGKMAGINSRMKDGRPGASTTIEIRNMGEPLYVIDGVSTNATAFNSLDYNDIESLTILKDASASIYGVRAANGVVVVTTKKGKRNTKNTVAISGYYGWQTPTSFPKAASASLYMEKYIQSETVQDPSRSSYTYSKDEYEKWKAGTDPKYKSFDWYDFIFNTGPQYYVNANISGGGDKSNYYVSIGHTNQDAMIVNYGGYTRSNFQMGLDTDITDRFRVGVTVNGYIDEKVNPGVPGGDDYWLPRFGVFRNLPTRRPYANDNPKYPTVTSTEDGTNFAWLNYELSGRMEDKWRSINLQGHAEYDIIDGLTAKFMGGYAFRQRHHDNQEYTYKLYGYDEATDTYEVIRHNKNPWRERTSEYVEEMTSNIQLNYNKRFGDHTVAAVVGFETLKVDNPKVWIHAMPITNAQNFIDYDIMDDYQDNSQTRNEDVGIERKQARMGWIGRLNYDYAGKYLLEASARYDGSWKFPPGHRWGFFPSASAGWRISEEAFWQESKLGSIFDNLKIRASYGLLGDDNLGKYNKDNRDWDYYRAHDYLSGYTYGSGTGTALDGKYYKPWRDRGLPVTTISWIEATILDVGIDVAFLNNRLTGQADFFRRHRKGLPDRRYDVLLPSEVGFDLPWENLKSDVHMGWETQVRWSDNIQDFNYSVGLNATYARIYDWEQYNPRFSNSWDEYKNSQHHRYSFVSYAVESDRQMWSYEAIGQFKSWEEIANYPVNIDGQGNKTMRPGDIIYKDVNGDGIINEMDQRPHGYRAGHTPILNFGLNFNAAWKGFDLAFDLTGGTFGTWNQEWEQQRPFHDGGNNAEYYLEDSWRLSDIWDANSELIPGKYPMPLIGQSWHSNYWKSTFWQHNVWYMKMRNFELGYTIPKFIMQKVGISDLRVYVGGQNLFTLTNVQGIDPETTDTNGLGYPTTRIINVGLNLKF